MFADRERCKSFWDSVPSKVLADELKSNATNSKFPSTPSKDILKSDPSAFFAEESARAAHESVVAARNFVDVFRVEQNLENDVETVIFERLKLMGVEDFLQTVNQDVLNALFEYLPSNCRTITLASKLILVRGIMYQLDKMTRKNKDLVLDTVGTGEGSCFRD